jgi:diguanylate cyclase (GGDEF)-like protein
MERSRKRTPIIQRSKGACTMGLALVMAFAIFGVGGAAAGDGTYSRLAREQRLAGLALAHRTPEQLLLAIKPKSSTPPAPAAANIQPAPATTPPAATTPADPAPTPPATTDLAPADTTTQAATTTTTPTTTSTTPTTTSTTPTTTGTTTTTTGTTTTPTTTDPTSTTPGDPGDTTGDGTDTTGDGTDTTGDGTDTTGDGTDPTTGSPASQASSAGSSGACHGRCSSSGSSSAAPSAAVPTATSSATSTNFILTSSPLDTSTPAATGTVTEPINAASSTTLTPVSTVTPTSTSSGSSSSNIQLIGIKSKSLTSASSLLNVTHSNATSRSSHTAPVGTAGGSAVTAAGATGGSPTAPAAGTRVAAASAAGATPGSHGTTSKHGTPKHPSSGGSSITAPLTPAAQALVKIVDHIPTAIWVALGAAFALALAFAAMALRSSRRARKQEREFAAISAAAQTDALTGILNRRGFMDAAERELARASRYDRPFVLAYVDVRGLKAVNDTEGHLMGDELIKAVAGLMKESARADDVVGRIGGDEFALLLGEQTAEGAEPVLRRIRARVDERRSGMEIRVPWELTIGIAAFPDDGTTLEELLGVADRRLYEQRGIALR